jgi:hypothetical protein
LIVEDDYFMADELRVALQQAGADVVGPVGRVSEARDLLERDGPIHGAVLDINLAGEMMFDVADSLGRGTSPLCSSPATTRRLSLQLTRQ